MRNIDTVKYRGDFSADHPKLSQLGGRYACWPKMSNKDIRFKRPRIPTANGRQNQIARLLAIAWNIQRFPGRCAGETVQSRRRPIFQLRQFAFRFIQQPARFFLQTVGIK